MLTLKQFELLLFLLFGGRKLKKVQPDRTGLENNRCHLNGSHETGSCRRKQSPGALQISHEDPLMLDLLP